ncbi:MAG: Error-prone repair protein ImuA [Chitinophagaceae bacterium]|nr:MAG: Error-prone repair protein ImuA [Chitinophagaceae bacterium]
MADFDILNRLRQEILPLQGFRHTKLPRESIPGFQSIESAFPGNCFPTGAIHDFICTDPSGAASTTGFISGLLSALMNKHQSAVWITSSQQLYPPALAHFGIDTERLIVIHAKEKEVLWIMEEALKCEGLAAVVCQVSKISFTASRRLQLAVEGTGVTGMLMLSSTHKNTSSSLARWCISSLPGIAPHGLPGLGFPRWKVKLEKVRNGKPSSWQIEWNGQQFVEITSREVSDFSILAKKAV